MLEEVRSLARGAESVDAEHAALCPDIAPPRLRGAGFDRDTEDHIRKVGLKIVGDRYVVPDLIKLIEVSVVK